MNKFQLASLIEETIKDEDIEVRMDALRILMMELFNEVTAKQQEVDDFDLAGFMAAGEKH